MRPFIIGTLLVTLPLGIGKVVPQELQKVTVGLSFSVEEYDPSTPSKEVIKCKVRNNTDKAIQVPAGYDGYKIRLHSTRSYMPRTETLEEARSVLVRIPNSKDDLKLVRIEPGKEQVVFEFPLDELLLRGRTKDRILEWDWPDWPLNSTPPFSPIYRKTDVNQEERERLVGCVFFTVRLKIGEQYVISNSAPLKVKTATDLKKDANKKADKSEGPSIVFDYRPSAGVPSEALDQKPSSPQTWPKLQELTDEIKTVRIRYFNKVSWTNEEQVRRYVRGYLANKSQATWGFQIWSQSVGVPEIECVIEYTDECLKKFGKPGYPEGRLLIWNTESCFRDVSGRWWFVNTFDHFHRFHPKGNRAYKEGVWIFQGPRNIVGAGTDTVVTLEKKQGKWLISYRYIRHFSVNDNKPPQETVTGPYEFSVAGPVLEYQGLNGVEKISYRFDGDSLVMPAVVRLDERTWMLQTTSTLYDTAKKTEMTRPEKYLWCCQSDPTMTHQGEAEFPPYGKQEGASKAQYTYIFSQEKDKAGRTTYILRFLVATKDKKDASESCRLTWNTEEVIHIEARSLPPQWHQRTYSLKRRP